MDNLPFDPQVIIFLVFIIIGAIKNFLGKAKPEEDASDLPSEPFPPNSTRRRAPLDEVDPMTDFNRMIEEARREAEETERLAEEAFLAASPPPVPEGREKPKSITLPVRKTPKATSFPPSKSAHKKKKSTSSIANANLSELLASPGAAKKAVLLSEVLGKPKGFQP